MTGSNAGGTIYQVGVQSTFDTAVAATAKLLVPRINLEPVDVVSRPQFAKGLAVRNPGEEHVVSRMTRVTVPAFPVPLEQLPWWLGMAIASGVSASGDPDTYTYTRDPAALPATSMATLERRLTEFTNHIDEEWPNLKLTRVTLSGAKDQDVMLSAEGFAAARASSTLTASLSAPSTPEIMPYALTELYRDSAWASAGNTQVTGQMLSWSFEIMNGAMPQATADGRANLDFGVIVYDPRNVGHRFTARFLQDKTAYNAEAAAARAQTLRAIRLAYDGTGSLAWNIDALVKHAGGNIFTVDESDGQVIYDVDMVDATDETNSLEVVAVTDNGEELGWAAA